MIDAPVRVYSASPSVFRTSPGLARSTYWLSGALAVVAAVLVGSILTMWVIKSVSVAVAQRMGSAADSTSTVASAAMTPVFGVLALVGLIPLYFYFRHLNDID